MGLIEIPASEGVTAKEVEAITEKFAELALIFNKIANPYIRETMEQDLLEIKSGAFDTEALFERLQRADRHLTAPNPEEFEVEEEDVEQESENLAYGFVRAWVNALEEGAEGKKKIKLNDELLPVKNCDAEAFYKEFLIFSVEEEDLPTIAEEFNKALFKGRDTVELVDGMKLRKKDGQVFLLNR